MNLSRLFSLSEEEVTTVSVMANIVNLMGSRVTWRQAPGLTSEGLARLD